MTNMRHGTSNPGMPGRHFTSPRLHPAYRNGPNPEKAKAFMQQWFAKMAARREVASE